MIGLCAKKERSLSRNTNTGWYAVKMDHEDPLDLKILILKHLTLKKKKKKSISIKFFVWETEYLKMNVPITLSIIASL